MNGTRLPAKRKKIIEILSLEVLLVSTLFIVLLFVLGFIVKEVLWENEINFDDSVFVFFCSFSTPLIIEIMKVFTFLGSVLFLIPAYPWRHRGHIGPSWHDRLPQNLLCRFLSIVNLCWHHKDLAAREKGRNFRSTKYLLYHQRHNPYKVFRSSC